MEFFSGKKTIGILGGGQLGKMLLYVTENGILKQKLWTQMKTPLKNWM